MFGDHRKRNKQSTGTVPKIKPYDFSRYPNLEERPTAYANNLTTYGHHPPDSFNILRNRRGAHQNNYFTMDAAMDGFLPSVQNMIANETTANTSSSNSRRNSSGSTLKCDNITKYPDKNQVEQRLEQIREYLKITSSLMTSMRNTDEQTSDLSEIESLEKMINDLKDSETKLTGILDHMNTEDGTYETQAIENGLDELSLHSTSSNIRNDIDINLDDPNHEIDALKEQQLSLMQLQQKAEYKLRGARQIHSNLLQASNESNSITYAKDSKNLSDFDAAIRELEERAKRLRPAEANNRTEEHFLAGVETLHNQMMSMRYANNEREHLIEALDNQDAALRSEHEELQNKLVELQKKKSQVDMLVAQLQSFGEEEDGDVGVQVRTIVTMKEQLKKLKDMLEIVKTTENIMQNTNSSAEVQAAASDICSTAEHFLDKKLPARVSNDTSTGVKPKQVNKNKKEQGSWRGDEGGRQKPKWNGKQNGLEDIMGTHKASTSNLNHNGCGAEENKSESNVWYPPSPQASVQYHPERRRRHRYVEEPSDDNHYVMASDPNVYYQPPRIESPVLSPDSKPPMFFLVDSPEHNRPKSNIEQEDEPEVREKLKCIKKLCDTMLENQTTSSGLLEAQGASGGLPEIQTTSNVTLNHPNVFQLRNNLTPSQLSEPANASNLEPQRADELYVAYRNPGCPCPKCQSVDLDAAESADDSPAEVPAELPDESTVVDILRQLCELVWTHQSEFQSLKNNVAWIQNKLESMQFRPEAREENAVPAPTPDPNPPLYRLTLTHAAGPNIKANKVSSAFSMPNLNQYMPPSTNTKPKSTGIPNDRCLDPGLNNTHAVAHSSNSQRPASSNHGQVMPNPIWNGQALNNQVAPGNRANNYWDNFRSYSRQNLFSTKNIDLHSPSTALDRSSAVNEQTLNEQTHPFMLSHPVYKSGQSRQTSMFAFQENAAHERCARYDVNPTPDVLNVNRSSAAKGRDQARAPSSGERYNADEWMQFGLNNYASNPNHSNAYDDRTRRNEDVSEKRGPKSKKFAEARETIYKEVAAFISANEYRPQFLIQLFKGLQMIEHSEAFGVKTLQAIQLLMIQSSNQNSQQAAEQSQHAANHSSRQPPQQSARQPDQQSFQKWDQQAARQSNQQSSRQPNQQSSRQQNQQSSRPQDQQSSRPQDQQSSRQQDQQSSQQPAAKSVMKKLPVWSPNALKNAEVEKKSPKYESIEERIGDYLDEHGNDVITNTHIVALRYLLTGCPAFGRPRRDLSFWSHFSPIIEIALTQYRGNRIFDIKELLIQTITDLDFEKNFPKKTSDHELPHLLLERGTNKSNVVEEAGAQEQQKDSAGLSEQSAEDQEASQQLSEQPPQQLPEPPRQLPEQPPQQVSEQQTANQTSRQQDQQQRKPSRNMPVYPKSLHNFEICRTFGNRQFIELEIGNYLDQRRNEIIRDRTILAMIQLLFGSSKFGKVTQDEAFNVVKNTLIFFVGSKISDVRDHVIRAISNAVPDIEFNYESYRESAPERRLPDITNGDTGVPEEARAPEQPNTSASLPKPADKIENEDLAEADQSRMTKEAAEEKEEEKEDEAEEEGAVGGVVDMTLGTESDNTSMETCIEEVPAADTVIEGLDQVPTKLPTKAKSRSSTPNKDPINAKLEYGLF